MSLLIVITRCSRSLSFVAYCVYTLLSLFVFYGRTDDSHVVPIQMSGKCTSASPIQTDADKDQQADRQI